MRALGPSLLMLAGCSLLFDIEAAEPAPPVNAGSDAATVPDVGEAIDAQVDVDATGKGVPFCENIRDATLCDDFDGAEALGARWAGAQLAAGGNLARVTDDSASLPSALRATLPKGCVDGSARLNVAQTSLASRIEHVFAVKFESLPKGVASLGGFNWNTSSGFFRVDILLLASGQWTLSLNDGMTVDVLTSSSETVATGVWYKVKTTIDLAGGRAQLSINDRTTVDQAKALATQSTPTLAMQLGWFSSNCQEQASALFDNVNYRIVPQ